MKNLLAAIACFSAFTVPACAATYTFRGIAEYGDVVGTPPNGIPVGSVVLVTMNLEAKTPGTITANTAIYAGGYGNGTVSPIIAITLVVAGRKSVIGPGVFDVVTVTQNPSGTSSITITSEEEMVGEEFYAVFQTTSPTANLPLAFPTKIDTTQFQDSTFRLAYPPGAYETTGHLANR